MTLVFKINIQSGFMCYIFEELENFKNLVINNQILNYNQIKLNKRKPIITNYNPKMSIPQSPLAKPSTLPSWVLPIFIPYAILFLVSIFLLGLNAIRLRQKFRIHPRLPCFIFPIILNLMLANTLFNSLHPFFSTLLLCLLAYAISIRMEKVRIIGVTGSIATGKSTLTNQIRTNFQDIDIIDCDQISRKLRRRGQPGYKLLIGMLGDRAQEYLNPLTKEFDQDGRQKLNQYVFNNKEFRDKLTRKMGILIITTVFKRILKNIITGKYVMVVDAPLLYESKILQHVCYPVAVVGCSQQTQIQRLMKRDGYSQQQARKRIASQMPLSQKRKKTKLYLNNQGSERDLRIQFASKIKRYLSKQVPKDYLIPQNYNSNSNLRKQ